VGWQAEVSELHQVSRTSESSLHAADESLRGSTSRRRLMCMLRSLSASVTQLIPLLLASLRKSGYVSLLLIVVILRSL